MAQIFSPRADFRFRLIVALLAIVLAFGGLAAFGFMRLADGWFTVGAAPVQPIPFDHQRHAGELGIDCRYCHDSVETAPYAGFPPMETCATCHYVATPRPDIPEAAAWIRVTNLADHVYFNHSIHIDKGIGCSTCHGRVDEMSRVSPVREFSMSWCLDCHRDPAPHLRPPEAVFDMAWQAPADQAARGQALVEQYGISVTRLDHCYVCHR